MSGRGLVLATMLAGLAACGPRAEAPRSLTDPEAGAEAAAVDPANPDRTQLDSVSADFCQLRSTGPPELIAFLNAVETCDSLRGPAERAQARCTNLGANETRLRSHYVGDAVVMAALNRARARPWPACSVAITAAIQDEPASGGEADAAPAPQDDSAE